MMGGGGIGPVGECVSGVNVGDGWGVQVVWVKGNEKKRQKSESE
jgi:hypothetical protein